MKESIQEDELIVLGDLAENFLGDLAESLLFMMKFSPTIGINRSVCCQDDPK